MRSVTRSAERARPGEHRVHHRRRELDGERVLLRGVEGAEDGQPVRRLRLRTWANLRPRPPAGVEEPPGGGPADQPEAQHDAGAPEERHLAVEEGGTGVLLLRERHVPGRGAAYGRGDEAVVQREAVLDVPGDGLVRVAGAVERREEEVARAVAGEDPAGPVRAVGGRSE